MRTVSRLSSTSRASRVSSTMPTVCRSRSTGSATVTSKLAVRGAADIGRHLAALVGAGQPDLLAHVGLPVRAGGGRRRGRSAAPARGAAAAPGSRRRCRRSCRAAAAIDGRRQRLGDHRAAGALPHPAVGDQRAVRARKAWPARSGSVRSAGAAAAAPGREPVRACSGRSSCTALSPARRRRSGPARAACATSCLQQPVLVLVEIEQRREQQRQRQRVDQQDAAQQRRHPALPDRRVAAGYGRSRTGGRVRRSLLLVAVADAVERLDLVELSSPARNFLRTRLTWLSIVRSST